jgi:hypothetical protein
MGLLKSPVTEDRRVAITAVCASIIAARKRATVPRNSPDYVVAISDAIADARRSWRAVELDGADRSPQAERYRCSQWPETETAGLSRNETI